MHFPGGKEAEFKWSGQVINSMDGLAFIGRNPGGENVYIVTGDSGMGMTHGTIAGMLLRDLIFGRENPWVSLYDPSRKSHRAASAFLSENRGKVCTIRIEQFVTSTCRLPRRVRRRPSHAG
jgi:glycine/D-amino acid oxidase-like deaminating enzyme